MLFFRAAIAIDRRARAARIADVNLGFAGGKDAQRALRELED